MTQKKNQLIPSGYTYVGHFHTATANSIGLPGGDIYISRNYIVHIKKGHAKQLEQLGFSVLGYVKSIFRCYNRIYGESPHAEAGRQSFLFVVYNPELSHVAAIQINHAHQKGFWEVHTAHPVSINTLRHRPLLYEKKNAETASFYMP